TMLAHYHRAWHVTPFWNFLVDKVLGRAAGPWDPYVRDESNAQVLGSDASYGSAGTGRPGPDGSYLVEANGSAVTATRTLANGVTITKRYAPGGEGNKVDVAVELTNRSAAAIDGVWVGVAETFHPPTGR